MKIEQALSQLELVTPGALGRASDFEAPKEGDTTGEPVIQRQDAGPAAMSQPKRKRYSVSSSVRRSSSPLTSGQSAVEMATIMVAASGRSEEAGEEPQHDAHATDDLEAANEHCLDLGSRDAELAEEGHRPLEVRELAVAGTREDDAE